MRFDNIAILLVLVATLLSVAGISGCAAVPEEEALVDTEPEIAEPPQPQPLVFREDWKADAPAGVLAPDHLANPDLDLMTVGSGTSGLRYAREADTATAFVQAGSCPNGPCAFTLRLRDRILDMTGHSGIRWRTMQDGFNELRAIVQLASGAWVVSEHSQGGTDDWAETTLFFDFIRWRQLNADTLTPERPVAPDFSRVQAVGGLCLTVEDLPCTEPDTPPRLDWIEVLGRTVP